jgi:iron complex outermembrane receptor protein
VNIECKYGPLRYTLLYIATFLALPLSGQTSLQTDTISIGEVVINGSRADPATTGYKKTSIDTTFLNYGTQNSLADILSQHSQIFIKSYGMGGNAAPSFRGTGAGHTQLAWNEINISHPMLGQSDLALVPAGLIDDVQIYYGGASMPLNSGGIGGIINLGTKPVWKKETLFSITPGIGSFGQYTGLVKVRTGTSRFQSVTKAFFQRSENNYPYMNTEIGNEPVPEKRTNSQMSQRGFIQELYFRREKSVMSARVWYESSHRNLPSSMLIRQPNLREAQSDESLRTQLNYNLSAGMNKLTVTGAWLIYNMNYTNSLASIDSRNFSRTFIFKTGFERNIYTYTTVKVVLNDELNYVNSNNYIDYTKRNTFSLTASAETNAGRRFGSMLLVREIIDTKNFLIPDFSAGLQFRMADRKDYYLKANLSRNSKIPTMNDMYWVPGGNPSLKNEYAFIYELSFEMKQKISGSVNMKYNLTGFRNNIHDMILWHPGEFSYWTADNVRSVNTTGLESSLSLNYSSGKFSTSLISNYSYTRATTTESATPNDASIGKQLIYVPIHQANTTLSANYNIFYISWIVTATGKRYLTADNTEYLPGYMLNNIITGSRLNVKGNIIDLNFHVDNIFNVNYQTIAYYPLPGRYYSLNLIIQIHKQNH